MKTRGWRVLVLAAVALFTGGGCAFLLPRTDASIRTKWHSYEEAQAAFERIGPYETRTNELAALGFDPSTNANVRILTYVDLIQRFLPNPSMTKDDLDPAVRGCIEAREQAQAWEVEWGDTKGHRYGNALLDVTGFVRKTHETGWQFKALVLIQDGRVVYKLSSGQPKVDRYDKRVRPLGPLQELDSFLVRMAPGLN